jgi:ferredoxin like protein
MMPLRLDQRLATLIFKPDREPHITIEKERCAACPARPCTNVCPAGLYVWENGEIIHNCDGCLECGSCRSVCPRGAITWRYPTGGYGVRFRWG